MSAFSDLKRGPITATLEAQRSAIYDRWKELLHLDRGISALASPSVLVYLIDQSIDEVLGSLQALGDTCPAAAAAPDFPCCGRNPYVAYFAAGRQAVREALVLTQSTVPYLSPAERDGEMARLNAGYEAIERRHIGLFCAICQFRPAASEPSAEEARP